MPEKNADQPDTGNFLFTDERLMDFLDIADHVYVICLSCTREVPTKLREKVSILNGRRSDECLSPYINWTKGKGYNHVHKVTLAHKLAITDAKAKNFNLSLVLEEDVLFKEDMEHIDFEPIAALVRDASRGWEILRLAWYDHLKKIARGCRAANVRNCSKWVSQNMCTIPSCDLHSSAAYMIPARSYDRFLTQGRGAIDGHVLNQFEQTVLTPPLCNQNHLIAPELKSETSFIKHCKGKTEF